jgi:type II secretory pathway component PulF
MKVRFTAKDAAGKTVKGTVEAGTLKAAAGAIREQRMTPVVLTEVKQGFSLANLNNMMGKVTSGDVTNFTRQMATMITAGLPLTDALNLLKVQSPPPLAKIITQVLVDVQAGVALSSAMAKHPKAFSKVYVALVKAGESAGLMEKILNRLADTAEKGREFKAKIVGAMIYPVIILIGMVGVMALMVVLVIPKMKDLYADFGSDLPMATKILLWISDTAVTYWWAIILLIVLVVWVLRWFITTEGGRRGFDKGIFKLPVMGPLVKQTILTEFTRTMALLLSAGISVVEALRIVADSMGNVIVEKDVKRIANQVEKGFPVSISFTESDFFPPIIGQMVAVGEETGKMDEVLSKISAYFETEADQKVKGLTTAIEPIILMIMAVGIGFLMYAIIMPIYDITNKV